MQFVPLLKEHDFTTHHVTASGGIRAILETLWQARQSDIVIVIRKTFPSAITWLLRLVSKKLIFDFDDAVFCSSTGVASKTRMSRFSNIVRCSDYIFAGNQFLAENALKFNDAVSVIPTCLDVEKYEVTTEKPNDVVDLVWIGSQSTSKYLIDILPLLERLAERLPTLRLKIISDFDLPEAKIPVLAITWNEVTEVQELVSSHIGIAPMRDNEWTKGKCALKVLQYMAASLPVVSANVGVNSEAVIMNETGLLAESTEHWMEAVTSLATNKTHCVAMGIEGHKRVKEHYDINSIFKNILAVLER
jgi:glycosyltransferase involved in cell wall biosynthesis